MFERDLFSYSVNTNEILLNLYNNIKNKFGIDYLSKYLNLHKGTIKRWEDLQEIPTNYFNDLNKLNDNLIKINLVKKERQNDEFFTTSEIALYCYNKLKDILKILNINYEKYIFIEPSVGNGVFYDLLPINKKIGIDINPQRNYFIKSDYLDFFPDKNKQYIVLGNPPFGLRGNLALRFIKHSYDFADVIAFILPPLFNSDGKGSPMKRVEGYELAYTESLPLNSFVYPNGKNVEVSTIFQVWTKINKDLINKSEKQTCKSYIKIFSLSDGGKPSNTRNKNMLYSCDAYLPSTCFKNMQIFDNFEQLPHRRGYGIIFLKEKQKMKELFYSIIDWKKISFLSTNSALNLRTSLIEQAIIEQGYYDK